MFAVAALIDEIAMGLPDLRPMWSQYSLQATRFSTNNAGVEVFERIRRVRQGPASVIATYSAILGIGFMGCYALPGADQYALA
jgi:type VI secretion system protein ImpK